MNEFDTLIKKAHSLLGPDAVVGGYSTNPPPHRFNPNNQHIKPVVSNANALGQGVKNTYNDLTQGAGGIWNDFTSGLDAMRQAIFGGAKHLGSEVNRQFIAPTSAAVQNYGHEFGQGAKNLADLSKYYGNQYWRAQTYFPRMAYQNAQGLYNGIGDFFNGLNSR